MVVLIIILTIILSLMLYVLFAPIDLKINSKANIFKIDFFKFFSGQLKESDETLFFQLNFFKWKKKIDLLKTNLSSQIKSTKIKKSNSTIFKPTRVWQLLKSFKILRLYLTLDTGNMQRNGILYPLVFWLARKSNRSIHINFLNQNEFILHVQNNVYRMLRAYWWN